MGETEAPASGLGPIYLLRDVGRGDSHAAALFSSRQRRATGERAGSKRWHAALEALERGDGSPARRLLSDAQPEPQRKDELLDRLTEHELFDTYDRHGARPDPDHPEHDLLREAVRA